tara:strand:+ start:43976 stop:44251 length:276 start_codon:yes stop_codon:yes gene_type:complete
LFQSVNSWKHDCAVALTGYQSIQNLPELVRKSKVEDFTDDDVIFRYCEKAQDALWSGNAKNMYCGSEWHIVCCIFETSAQGVCRRVNLLEC